MHVYIYKSLRLFFTTQLNQLDRFSWFLRAHGSLLGAEMSQAKPSEDDRGLHTDRGPRVKAWSLRHGTALLPSPPADSDSPPLRLGGFFPLLI